MSQKGEPVILSAFFLARRTSDDFRDLIAGGTAFHQRLSFLEKPHEGVQVPNIAGGPSAKVGPQDDSVLSK
jgi:hypothetical protein